MDLKEICWTLLHSDTGLCVLGNNVVCISPSDRVFHLLCVSTYQVSMASPIPTLSMLSLPFFWEDHKAALKIIFIVVGQAHTRACWIPYAEFNLTTQCAQLIHRDFCDSCQPVLPPSCSSRFVFWSVPTLNSSIYFVNLTAYLEMVIVGYHCVSLAATFLG